MSIQESVEETHVPLKEGQMPEVYQGIFMWKPDGGVAPLTPEVIEYLVEGLENPEQARVSFQQLQVQREELKRNLEKPLWKKL